MTNNDKDLTKKTYPDLNNRTCINSDKVWRMLTLELVKTATLEIEYWKSNYKVKY